MKTVSMRAILASAAFSTLLAGCATTVGMGPGYYTYDSRLATSSTPPVVYQEPAVVYREPAIVYREPTVVYRDSALVYREPTVVYRSGRDSVFFNDHGQ